MVLNEEKRGNITAFSKTEKRAVAHFSVRGKLDYFPSEFGISFWIYKLPPALILLHFQTLNYFANS